MLSPCPPFWHLILLHLLCWQTCHPNHSHRWFYPHSTEQYNPNNLQVGFIRTLQNNTTQTIYTLVLSTLYRTIQPKQFTHWFYPHSTEQYNPNNLHVGFIHTLQNITTQTIYIWFYPHSTEQYNPNNLHVGIIHTLQNNTTQTFYRLVLSTLYRTIQPKQFTPCK